MEKVYIVGNNQLSSTMRIIRFSFLPCLLFLFFAACTNDEAQNETKEAHFQFIAASSSYKGMMESQTELVTAFEALDQKSFETFISNNEDFFSDSESSVNKLPDELKKIKGAESYIQAILNATEAKNAFYREFPDYEVTLSKEQKIQIMKIWKESSLFQQ